MLRFLALLLIVLGTLASRPIHAQTYYPVTHTSGTQIVGGDNTTVTSVGVATSLTYCGVSPYRIGSTPAIPDGYGRFTFTFATPITGFRLQFAGLNAGEVDSVFINGIFYPLSSAGLSAYPGTCSQPIAQIVNGTITGTVVGGGGGGGELTIIPGNISSITVSANSVGGAGNVFALSIATNGIAAANNSPLCSKNLSTGGPTLNLSSTFIAGAAYQWTGPNGFTSNQQNPSIPNVTTAASGVYTVTATSGSVSVNATTTVTINPAPRAGTVFFSNLVNPSSCTASDGSFTLNGVDLFVTQISYLKNGVLITIPVTVSPSGTVTVTGLTAGSYADSIFTSAAGCSDYGTHSPSILTAPAPPVPVVTSPITYCQNATASPLSAIALAGNTLRWYTVATGGTGNTTAPVPSTTAIGTVIYYVTQTASGGCESSRAAITVNIIAPASAPVITSNSPVCAGSTLNLSGPAGANSYSWSGPNGFNSSVRNPSIANASTAASGTYSLTISVNGCSALPGTISIVVNPAPAIGSVTGNNPVTCGGNEGSIYIDGTTPASSFTVSYSFNGGSSVTQVLTSSSTGRIIIPNLVGGTYNQITIADNTCSTISTTTIVLAGPAASPTPIITSNSPVCAGSTITLGTTSAGPYQWSGPNGFTSTAQNPAIPATAAASGVYQLIVTTSSCPSLPARITVVVNPIPAPPAATSNSPLCIGDTIKLSGSSVANAVYSWTGPNGFTSALQKPVILNAAAANAGVYTLSVMANGCAATGTGNATVVVNALPIAPTATNVTYCLNETASPLMATPAAGNTLRWYTTATGGTGSTTAPTPSTQNGNLTYYVSQVNSSGCESPRTPLTVTITIIPGPVVSSPVTLCQFQVTGPLTATGDSIRWYGTPTGGNASVTAPTPVTTVPGTFNYYVTQKQGGCTSPRVQVTVIVNEKPAPPGVTSPLRLCQYDTVVLAADGLNTRWYLHPTGGGGITPFSPPTGGVNDSTYYYATQTVNGCESDRSRLLVTVTYKPNGIISPSRLALCQDELDTFFYYGNARPDAVYNWVNPKPNTTEISGAGTQGPYVVRFDSSGTYNISVQVNNRGCLSDIAYQPVTVRVRPAIRFVAKEDACVDEIVNVALSYISPNIDSFRYQFAGGTIRYGAASGGPFGVSFATPGLKVISNTAFTKGCPSRLTQDTINVHPYPDARFTVTATSGGSTFCNGDSLVLTARTADSNDHFVWMPDNFFTSGNLYTAKGFLTKSGYVKLQLTSRYGCISSDSLYVQTESCCRVFFPNAFSPNNDQKNDRFRPVSRGHHEVKTFRIINRWGQVVYESKDEVQGWDGTYNGKDQDVGTYYYYLSYNCGEGTGTDNRAQLEEKGEFLLIR